MVALVHAGILKMRWGVRRYQNPDGTYTELGKQRKAELRRKRLSKLAKKRYAAKKRSEKVGAVSRFVNKLPVVGYKKKAIQAKAEKRRVADMSDDELKRRIARMKLENEYNDQYNKLHPKKQHKILNAIGKFAGTTLRKALDAGVTAAIDEAFKNNGNKGNRGNNGNNNNNNP